MIAGWLGNVWAKIAAVGAIVLAVLAGLAKVYGAGKTAEREKGLEQEIEAIATRGKVDSDLARRSDDDVRERLRSKWTRRG